MRSFLLASLLLAFLTTSACATSKTTEPAPESEDSVWVGKSDGARLCEKGTGIPLDFALKELETNGIKILGRKKIGDGKMRIQMCGGDKGDMNGALISRKDIDKAKEHGFTPVSGNH